MKKYQKPMIIEEEIQLEDVIASSGPQNGETNDGVHSQTFGFMSDLFKSNK